MVRIMFPEWFTSALCATAVRDITMIFLTFAQFKTKGKS
jgi:hypothetical protein